MLQWLLHLKKRLYVYVTLVFIIALLTGHFVNFRNMNLMPVSIAAVFIMLYPMLTGMEVEKVKKAGRNMMKSMAATLQ